VRRAQALAAVGGLGILAAAPVAVRAQAAKTVRLALAEGDDATPSLYAAQAGLFKKYGLDVQISPAPSGAAGLAALAGGAVEITGTSIFGLLSAHVRGLPLQVVGPLAISTPDARYAAIVVKKDAPYKTGRDFAGKTIASSALRDLNWVATCAWIDQHGGDSSTLKTVELGAPVIPTALAEGRCDVSTVTTPRYVQAVNQGLIRVLDYSYDAIAKRFLFSVFVAQTDYAAKNPDVILAFGRAIRDAIAYTASHHAETLPLYAGFAKIDPKDIADAPRAQCPPYVEAADLQPVIDVAVRYKIIEKAFDAHELLSPAILKPGA
jgi:NitT/TauT family transport system substrate-binding protein